MVLITSLKTSLIVGLIQLLISYDVHAGLEVDEANYPAPSPRLPSQVVPKLYELKLHLDQVGASSFEGELSISIDILAQSKDSKRSKLGRLFGSCFRGSSGSDDDNGQHHDMCVRDQKAPEEIVLHADPSIEIHWAKFEPFESTSPTVVFQHMTRYPKEQMIGLRPPNKGLLKIGGRGRLRLKFTALYSDSDDRRGVYEKRYPGTPPYRYVATSFQPSDARRAFPCFDEPHLKAQFELTIYHREDEIALSNGRAIRSHPKKSGGQVTEFAPTPEMSVHMFAFIVGERLEHVERVGVGLSQIPVRVYTLPGHVGGAEFALETACEALIYMERYTGIPYPMQKFDLVALHDRDKDNTESWALTVVRTNLTLLDEETREDLKITIGVNVAHVVAHQWFANLITAESWEHLWITEMLAAKYAFDFVQQVHPEYDSEYFVRLATLSGILQMDSHVLDGMHPLSPPADQLQSSSGAYKIFDNLTFTKGGSLAQLLENKLGFEQFREAMRILLERNAYKSITYAELSGAIELASGHKDYLTKFSSQVYKSSYPIIKVDVEDDVKIKLNMSRVQADELGLRVKFGSLKGNLRSEMAVDSKESEIIPPHWFDSERFWFKFCPKADLSTYFRIGYSDKLIASSLGQAIEEKKIDPLGRLELLDDAVGLLQMQELEPASLASLLNRYIEEDNGGVILEMLQASKALKLAQVTSSPRIGFVFLKVFERFWFNSPPSGSFLDKRAQTATLGALVAQNNTEVIEAALFKFDNCKGQILELHLREPIYAAVVAHGKEDQLENLIGHLERTSSLDEQVRLVSALSKSKNKTALERVGNWLAHSDLPEDLRKPLEMALA